MQNQFDQLRRLRAKTANFEEKRGILEALISVGTYDQLEILLRTISGKIYRDKILDKMLSLGTNQVKTSRETAQNKELTSPSKVKSLPGKQFDVFIAHASEDKGFITPLALSLKQRGLRVWYDDFILKVGDSLRREIDKGLAQSRYGVVILSHNFFAKHWPQKELDGLVVKEQLGEKVILPVWHNIDKEEVAFYSPTLADIVAVKSSIGIEAVANKIIEAISPDNLNERR